MVMERRVEAAEKLKLSSKAVGRTGGFDEVEAADGVVDSQGLVGGAEETCSGGFLCASADRDEVWKRDVALAELLGDERSEAGKRDSAAAVLVAGVEMVGRQLVVGLKSANAAQEGGVLHELCEAGEVLADSDAGDGGFDGAEFAADIGRGVGLGIECVDVAGTP